ncbi:MAG TPA: helix-turn-helix domain-containing protein [Pyrinomonadaceae bacterium]|nr:helix-turn-helix domain-containing protein [Pyrinomonadaceae bacterium]
MEPRKKTNANGNLARMAGGERRLQILRVAMRLFSQHGFRGTTTKEIAAAAGVSEAMVFRHFATKEELYSAILDQKACVHDEMDPRQIVAEAIARKDDAAVFEGIALDALNHHESDPEFQRLLLHSALEQHELAQMFWDKFVRRVYKSLTAYIRERQREGAIVNIEPAIVIRAFIGMVMHHSLNNNLWDRKRSLLKISNQAAARAFTEILLNGVAARPQSKTNGNGRTRSRIVTSKTTPKRKRSKK